MGTTSVKLMLLGIGLILFGMASFNTIDPLLLSFVHASYVRPTQLLLVESVVPIIGFVLLLVGFFKKAA